MVVMVEAASTVSHSELFVHNSPVSHLKFLIQHFGIMFDSTSRYFSIDQAKLVVKNPDGTTREIAYVRRRFVPAPEASAVLAEHTVTQGERLDNITANYLGDPTQFWRIADANLEASPLDLTDEPGETIIIPLPTD